MFSPLQSMKTLRRFFFFPESQFKLIKSYLLVEEIEISVQITENHNSKIFFDLMFRMCWWRWWYCLNVTDQSTFWWHRVVSWNSDPDHIQWVSKIQMESVDLIQTRVLEVADDVMMTV